MYNKNHISGVFVWWLHVPALYGPRVHNIYKYYVLLYGLSVNYSDYSSCDECTYIRTISNLTWRLYTLVICLWLHLYHYMYALAFVSCPVINVYFVNAHTIDLFHTIFVNVILMPLTYYTVWGSLRIEHVIVLLGYIE